jgi:hypothetical protein
MTETGMPLSVLAAAARRSFIGGSDARIIMGDDEAALLRLWAGRGRARRPLGQSRRSARIQANHLKEFREARQALPASGEVVHTFFGQVDSVSHNPNPASRDVANATEAVPELKPIVPAVDPSVELTRCFLRLANLPNFALDRLSRYEATLWRQARQTLLALDALDRHKPQERTRHFCVDDAYLRVR